MRPSQRKATLAAGAAGVLVLVLGGTTVALAQSPDSAVTATPTVSGSAHPKDGDRQQHRDELAAALAAELGVDKDKVAAALAKYDAEHKPTGRPSNGTRPDLTSRLDAAVKAGTITQAEADAIKKAAAAGVLGGPGGRPAR
jgi:hypothetical protein